MDNREKILEQGTKYANENWNVHENPNQHDNAHDDFIAGALWAVKNCSMSVVSFSSRDMLKEIIEECPYIIDYATVPKDKDMSNPQIAGSLIISYQRYLKAQEIVSDES